MEIKKRKTILIILMLVIILTTDFFALNSGIKTYATQLNKETTNANVEFSAYFKEGESRVDSIEKSIKAEDVKLYAEITVKNEGYLKEGTTLELENNNFNLKNEILSTNTHINSIEGNKVNLKQINNGETVEIELGIEPIIKEKITTDFLSKSTKVSMVGVYVYSKAEEGQSIRTDRTVCMEYQPDETAKAELVANIITNKIFSVDGINKRVIQTQVKSRLSDNEYPVKQTIINVNIPKLGEEKTEVSTVVIGKLATNGKTETKNIEKEEENVKITIENEADENNEVSWSKNTYDEIIVTYIYPETVDASKIEITANSEIKLQGEGNTYTAKYTKGIENQEPNNVVIGKTEITTEELYKGKIYAKIEEQYETKTSIVVTNEKVEDKIKVKEGSDVFKTTEEEKTANTRYVSTTINLEKMLSILGQEGKIEIKNGEETTIVNKDTEVDENGNVVINYEKRASELEITTSKPTNTGTIELQHKKAIEANGYTRTQIQEIKAIKTKGNITASLEENPIVENTIETSELELKETITKAELTLDKTTLSTTETNEVTLGVKLITDGTQYDLYKNPTIAIKLPKAVENVELISTPNKQNANEFTLNVETFNKTNKTLKLSFNGEQVLYPESELTQGYVQLNLKVTLDPLAISQTDKIIMAYTNENATQYYGGRTDAGIIEQEISISAPDQLIKKYNISSNENISLTDILVEKLDKKALGKTINFEIKLINNKNSNLKNLKILGKLPTANNVISGQNENTLKTNLKEIVAQNATVYYTENSNATLDIENTENGWETKFNENAKMYLIKVDSLERGTEFETTVTIQIPSSIPEDVMSYSQYEVTYNTETSNEIKEDSRIIGLVSQMSTGIKTEVVAQVGQDVLKTGDTIKEGEVIKYTVTVKNNETKTLKNIQLKLNIPKGTTYVKPIDNFVYEDVYYEEVTNSEELSKITTITIPELTAQNTYTTEYEVRVNKGTAGSKIVNEIKAIYDGIEAKSNKTENSIEEGEIRVSVKRGLDLSIPLSNSGEVMYTINIDNLVDKKIENIEVEIIAEGFSIDEIDGGNEKLEKITLEENENRILYLRGTTYEDARNVGIYVIIKDTNGKTYRSNLLNKEYIPYQEETITMTSPQDKKYIKKGDIVEYNIVIKNTGKIKNNIHVYDKIPQILQIKSVIKDGKTIMQVEDEKQEGYIKTIDNTLTTATVLEPDCSSEYKIYAEVKDIADIHNGEIITNVATANDVSSEIITHILKTNDVQDDNLENIISGNVWYDENKNGRKEAKEECVPDIIVKLYDLSTQDYLRNTEGEIIQTTTSNKGEYSFSKIKDGSYIIVFEYDTKKYEPTIQKAEGIGSSTNSKAIVKYINLQGKVEKVTAINVGKVNKNIFEMNLGLKENTGDWSNVINPENPNTPNIPDDSNDFEGSDTNSSYSVSGLAWLDSNENGIKDKQEIVLSEIKVRLYNVSSKGYLKDKSGNILEVMTDSNGKYEFNNIQKGTYIVIFEYNTEEYKLINSTSGLVLKKINLKGQELTVAVTDTLNIYTDVIINLKLKENLKFDLELTKYISKIVVQTNKETKSYDYDGKTLGKVEIHRKQIQGANVVLEYTIKVKNTGAIAGYAKNIVDYLPSGLTFSSELNNDWYLSGNNLHTKSLENTELKPGEEKEVKLILTKTMTNENVGLINNRAEIYEHYNEYGENDIDSTPNNQVQDEDDYGTTDVIIQIATGGSIALYIIIALINLALISVVILIMIKNNFSKHNLL